MRDAGIGERIYTTFPWRRDVIVRPRGADVKMIGPDGRAPELRPRVIANDDSIAIWCQRAVNARLWHADVMLGSAVCQQPMYGSPPAETLTAAAERAANK